MQQRTKTLETGSCTGSVLSLLPVTTLCPGGCGACSQLNKTSQSEPSEPSDNLSRARGAGPGCGDVTSPAVHAPSHPGPSPLLLQPLSLGWVQLLLFSSHPLLLFFSGDSSSSSVLSFATPCLSILSSPSATPFYISFSSLLEEVLLLLFYS